MYHAQYGDGATTIVQGALEFPTWIVDEPGPGAEWNERLRAAADLVIATAGVDLTVRVLVDAAGVHRQLFFTCRDDACDALDRLARHFLRLDDGTGTVVRSAATREAYDALHAALPERCVALAGGPLRKDGVVVLDDFRLLETLGAIGTAALTEGQAVCWQGAFRRFVADPEQRRAITRNDIALEALPGLPTALRDYQRAITRAFVGAGYVIDECLWVSAPAVPIAQSAVAERWRDGPGRIGLPTCEVTEVEPARREVLACALHAALFHTPSAFGLAAAAVPRAFVADAIAWRPPLAWRALVGAGNAPVLRASATQYLERIETRLTALEKALAARQAAADECAELRKAIGISQQDPAFALVKARQILEKIVRRLYREHRPDLSQKALLFDMIRDLTGQAKRPAVLPRRIGHYLDTIRVLGNLEAHATADEGGAAVAVSPADVELSLLMMLNVIEWYLLEAQPGAGASAASA